MSSEPYVQNWFVSQGVLWVGLRRSQHRPSKTYGSSEVGDCFVTADIPVSSRLEMRQKNGVLLHTIDLGTKEAAHSSQ